MGIDMEWGCIQFSSSCPISRLIFCFLSNSQLNFNSKSEPTIFTLSINLYATLIELASDSFILFIIF